MATPAQITASRANGQQSHGPSSVEGKAVSSRNALKLGITAQSMVIPGEDPAELDQLTAEYEEHYQPAGPVESALVQTIVRAQWMQRRCDRIEANFLNSRLAAMEGAAHALGAVVAQDSEKGNTLQKIFRRRQAAQREWYQAVDALRLLQNERRRATKHAAFVAANSPSSPPRVRFENTPQPTERPAAEPVAAPAANLALRL